MDNGILINDTDANENPLEAELISSVETGLLELNSDGSFQFEPALNFTGSVTFQYQASDGQDKSGITKVIIDVEETDLTLQGTVNDDRLIGTPFNENIFGFAGNDTLRGAAGDDTIRGGNGKDILRGGSGDDILIGGKQGDRLVGGQGFDSLSGGKGDDSFIFLNSNHKPKQILDFESTKDRLLISKNGFNLNLDKGKLPSSRFILGSKANWTLDKLK